MARFSVRYVHPISPRLSDTGPDVEIPDGAFADRKKLAAVLRQQGALCSGARIKGFRVEGPNVVAFPVCPGITSYWHSVTLAPIVGR